MKNVPHPLTAQIWNRLIRLQYVKGDLMELKELEHLTNDEFISIFRYLLGNGYVRALSRISHIQPTYFVTDRDNLAGTSAVEFYLQERYLNGTILKKYLDNALSSLGELIVNTVPLDPQTNPPGINVELVNESSRLRELRERLQSRILVDTVEAQKNEDKDGDRDKFHFRFEKEDGSKIIFIAQFSGTWLASNRPVTDSELIATMSGKIRKYIHDNEDILPGVIYRLRCVCATSSHGEDGIQLDSLEEVEAISMIELIYKYE